MRSRHPYVALVVATLTLVLGAGLVSRGSAGTPRESTAHRCARFSAASAAAERAVTGEGRRTAVIGDSYSVGLGLHSPRLSWAHRLPGRVEVFGFSGSGFSSKASPCRGVAFAQRALGAVASRPDLVVVEGGLNDFNQSDQQITRGFAALMPLLAGQQVLVVGPADAPSRHAGAVRVDHLLSALCATRGVDYLSMIDQHYRYRADRLHLTAASHRAFGDRVAAALPR